MIDFHCHLDLYQNSKEMLSVVSKNNIFTLVVTTSPRAWQMTSQIFSGYENIKVAIGMHPEIISSKFNERSLLLSSIPKTRFVGEVGIDGSDKYKDTLSLQESIFTDILIKCQSGGKILSIHSRNVECWFSINPAMTRNSKGRMLIKEMPINKILLETDGPFVKKCSKPYMPWETTIIIDELAEIKELNTEEIRAQLYKNTNFLLDNKIY